MTKAKQFLEEMSKPEAVASLDLSNEIHTRFAPRRVKKTYDNGTIERRMKFDDNSYCIIDDQAGVLKLPVQFA